MTEADKRQKNIKLYPIYKMFSWDLLFYYAIIFLFLTQEKGLTASDILLADAFYPLSKLALQIPCVVLADWLGKRKSVIIANISISISILLLIIGEELITLIFFNIMLAFSYNLKDMCESSILYNSILNSEEKLNTFSKYDGKGTSFHYYLDSVSAIATGFLFTFNSYLPMIFCFIFSCISIYLAFKFESIQNTKTKKDAIISTAFKNYTIELKDIFKFILNSNRLKSLLFFSAIFASFLSLMSTLRTSILVELDIPEIYFGIIFAILQFISGIASKKHLIFNKIFSNKTLSFIALGNSILLILSGLVIYCSLPNSIISIIIGIWFVYYTISKGIYYPIIKRYLNSFTIPKINTKIYSTQTIFDSLIRIPITLLASYILSLAYTSTTFIVLGLILSIGFIFLLYYMNDKVGLKPEEYDRNEIYYNPATR